MSMKVGSQPTLTREQVRELAEKNDGRPINTARVRSDSGQTFTRDFWVRENEVHLVTLNPYC